MGAPTHAAPNLGESHDVVHAGSDAMLIVDPLLNIIYPQVFYWYFGHFSRFVAKNDYRIEWNLQNVTAKKSDVEMMSFYNKDKDLVSVIIMNPTGDKWSYQLNDG